MPLLFRQVLVIPAFARGLLVRKCPTGAFQCDKEVSYDLTTPFACVPFPSTSVKLFRFEKITETIETLTNRVTFSFKMLVLLVPLYSAYIHINAAKRYVYYYNRKFLPYKRQIEQSPRQS